LVHIISAGASRIDERLDDALKKGPGSMPWYEKYIRVFYREIFLDKADDGAELSFWLCQMLSSLPLVYQARMLYILYGPEDTDGISNAIMFTLQYIHHIKTTKMTK
jgi:F-box protein 47